MTNSIRLSTGRAAAFGTAKLVHQQVEPFANAVRQSAITVRGASASRQHEDE